MASFNAELYKIVKDYSKHEDTLLTHRLNWALLTSSFMLTSCAILISALANNFDNAHPIFWIILIISVSGLVVTLFSFVGVFAANWAMRCLRIFLDENGAAGTAALLPDLYGGGSNRAKWLGFIYPYAILSTLALIWILAAWVSYSAIELFSFEAG
jgi:hypothetical protein